MRADLAGQTFMTEAGQPIWIELPVVSTTASRQTDPPMWADITIASDPPGRVHSTTVEYQPDTNSIRIPLSGIPAGSGTVVRVDLHDPGGSRWVEGTEFDSYPEGSRLQDGAAVGGDLSFRVAYRRSLLAVIGRGLSVAESTPWLLLAFLATFSAAGLLLRGWLGRQLALDSAEWLSLSLSGGLLVATALGYAMAILRLRPQPMWMLPSLVVLATAGAVLWARSKQDHASFSMGMGFLVLWLLVMAGLRLAFGANLPLPLHVDSIENYSIVVDILNPGSTPLAVNQVSGLLSNYYHFGFHTLAAWLLGLAGTQNPQRLVVLGQLLQALAIGAVYFPLRAATDDPRAAMTAVALAGLGWAMPAFASNWGKMSALAGLAAAPAVIGLAIHSFRRRQSHRWWLVFATVLAAILAALVHTRIIFVFAALALATWLAWMTLRLRSTTHGNLMKLVLGLLVLGSVAIVLLGDPMQLATAQEALADTLGASGGVTTIAIVLLIPFALQQCPLAALSSMLWAVLLLLFHFIPPHADYPLPLLDGPMISMALFLPLSALGGIGFAGLVSMVQHEIHRKSLRSASLLVILACSVGYAAWSLTNQLLTPDDCCMLAGRDDAAMARSIDATLGRQVRVLVAGDAPGGYTLVPIDGGAWMRPLTHREIVTMRPHVDFSTAAMHRRLCDLGITHIYVGMRSDGFGRAALDLSPDYYQPSIVYPRAALYSVLGCQSGQGS
jgi:hypothetical protein